MFTIEVRFRENARFPASTVRRDEKCSALGDQGNATKITHWIWGFLQVLKENEAKRKKYFAVEFTFREERCYTYFCYCKCKCTK